MRLLVNLEKRATAIWEEQARLISQLGKTKIPQARIEEQYEKLEQERVQLQNRIGELSAQRDTARAQAFPVEDVKQACEMLARGIDSLDFEDCQRLVQLLSVRSFSGRLG